MGDEEEEDGDNDFLVEGVAFFHLGEDMAFPPLPLDTYAMVVVHLLLEEALLIPSVPHRVLELVASFHEEVGEPFDQPLLPVVFLVS